MCSHCYDESIIWSLTIHVTIIIFSIKILRKSKTVEEFYRIPKDLKDL
jgi:hypothetical protein